MSKPLKKRTIVLASIALAVILAAVGTYLLKHSSTSSNVVTANTAYSPPKSSGASSKGGSGATNAQNTTTGTTPTETNKNGQTVISSAPPKPTGQLVSVSSVSLAQNPGPLNSVCQTVSGATCEIKFTKSDGTYKYLGPTAADSNGVVNFYWYAGNSSPDSNTALNLSIGTWTVQAIAALSGQNSKSDSSTLEVKP